MTPPRSAIVERKTHETEIKVSLDLDGDGTSDVATGVGFFDHMLAHVARHGLFDLKVTAAGDLHVDDHHTIEDVGIALGLLEQQSQPRRGQRRHRRDASVLDPLEHDLGVFV